MSTPCPIVPDFFYQLFFDGANKAEARDCLASLAMTTGECFSADQELLFRAEYPACSCGSATAAG
jgi:hypothetical protein